MAQPSHRTQPVPERLDQHRSRNIEPPPMRTKPSRGRRSRMRSHWIAPIPEAVITASASAYGIHGDYVTTSTSDSASGRGTTTPTSELMRVSGSTIRKIRCAVIPDLGVEEVGKSGQRLQMRTSMAIQDIIQHHRTGCHELPRAQTRQPSNPTSAHRHAIHQLRRSETQPL